MTSAAKSPHPGIVHLTWCRLEIRFAFCMIVLEVSPAQELDGWRPARSNVEVMLLSFVITICNVSFYWHYILVSTL